MFDLDSSLDRIPVSPDAIERVAWSLNLTPVAGADFAGGEARAYAVTTSVGGGRSDCYVCMYVSSLDRVQVYRHRRNSFPSAEGEAREEEALAFLEELGFILESIDYRSWNSRERQDWFDKQPPFHPRRPPPETPPVPREAVAAAAAAPAPADEGEPEMPGMLILADSVEEVPSRAAPSPVARAAPAPRSGAVARVSAPPAEVAAEVPAKQRPVKVDLPEEYEDLARLFASF